METKNDDRKPSRFMLKAIVFVLITLGVFTVTFSEVARRYILPRMYNNSSEPVDLERIPKFVTPRHVLRVKVFLEMGTVKWDERSCYNGDAKTLKLCRAIKAHNVEKMQSLIDAGADVNVKGKDGTPLLLWALPYGPETFECLLKNGADPNLILESDHGRSSVVTPGCTILYSAVRFINISAPRYDVYVDLLLKYGADPDLGKKKPIYETCFLDRMEGAFNSLLNAGADVNIFDDDAKDYLLTSCDRKGRWDRALVLLEHGATYDPETPQGIRLKELVEMELEGKGFLRVAPQKRKDDFAKVVKWLEDHGAVFNAKQNEVEE